jgi:hypothetical protein
MVPEDIEACLGLLWPEVLRNEQFRQQLPALWREILEADIMPAMVVEAETSPTERRIVAFRIATFVTEAFGERLKANPEPNLGDLLVEEWSSGNSPLLSYAAVAQANAGEGITGAFLFSGYEPGDEAWFLTVFATAIRAWFAMYQGFKFREVIELARGERLMNAVRNGGWRLLTDYAAFYARQLQPPAAEERCYLMGGTREETLLTPGTHLYHCLLYTPPRLFLTPEQQRLVKRALLDETDIEIAESLNLSLIAIKKRWQALYLRVDTEVPEFFATVTRELGGQRRRHLLHYLRDHPEELRPYLRA